jgi:uncharacterized membrane protein YeaQ/YmgE (transglycosylase-associated protein family)
MRRKGSPTSGHHRKERHLTMDDIGFFDIVWYIIAGLIIGGLARLLLPGKQSMGWIATMILGVVGAIVGGLIWNAIFSGNEGIAWIGSIIAAIILLVIYERVVAKRQA